MFGKEENTGKMPFTSHHNKGRYYKHKLTLFMLTLITRLRQHLPSFSTLKFFFPHFLYCSIQKKVTVAAHTEEMGIYAQIPWRQTMSIYYWNCFTHEIFYSPHLFIYLNHLLVSVWTQMFYMESLCNFILFYTQNVGSSFSCTSYESSPYSHKCVCGSWVNVFL